MRRLVENLEIVGQTQGAYADVLNPEALELVGRLQRTFGARREELLRARTARQAKLDSGELPDFLEGTRAVREGDWKIPPVPRDLAERKVEITGPCDRKMVINALNSGASTFMADFEDSCSPTWENLILGQANLTDALRRKIDFAGPNGKSYQLNEKVATLLVRPRGWHLEEKHLRHDGKPLAASFVDFGLYFFNNWKHLQALGTGPYFYLPKMESHLEARLWNDVFCLAEDHVGLARGTIKATVLIETILAAFEMDEILHELKEHAAGLNAGRWDYLFSTIKKFAHKTGFVFPDRDQLSMTVPFMRAYTELLVKTCHRRGAHAMGGMAAFIPSRKDAAVNTAAFAKVRADKTREAEDGFDGTWVAHPDLVAVAREEFDKVLGARPNQLERQRDDVKVEARQLIDFQIPGSTTTEAGLRSNVSVALQYLESWLRGVGAVGINNLMEDAATAEISRSQIWQWCRAGARLQDGAPVTPERVKRYVAEEVARLRKTGAFEGKSRLEDAATLFEKVALSLTFVDFLTIPAYEVLE